MKKLLCVIMALSCVTMFASCRSDDDNGVSKVDTVSSQAQTSDVKLMDVVNWVTLDIWNKGFCDIYHYVENGKDSTGQELDIDFTVDNLKIAYKKNEEYNEFIHSLDDSIDEQAQLIKAWDKMYEEMDTLYDKVVSDFMSLVLK